jgi:hypothetical protein
VKVRTVLPLLFLLSVFVLSASADEPKDPSLPKPVKHAGLDQFKQLAGEWVAKDPHDGKEMTVVYKVTSNGSAVVETIMPGTAHEMLTIIHPDGDDLLLTHYCALGNQPKMRAKTKGEDKKVAFEFVEATNLKSDKDSHMHSVAYTFVDKDTLKAEWTHYMDGKDAGKMEIELKRKK